MEHKILDYPYPTEFTCKDCLWSPQRENVLYTRCGICKDKKYKYMGLYYKQFVCESCEIYDFNCSVCSRNKKRARWRQSDRLRKEKEKKKEKINCECGSVIAPNYLSKHIKTKKHLKYLSNKE
jgi:hypothetical protein